MRSSRKLTDVAHHVVVRGERLRLRRRAGVRDHERRAGVGARAGDALVGQAAHVVDHRCTGLERGARHRPAPGVHGHERALRGEALDERDHPRDLLLHGHRLGVGAAGLAAHVHDRRAVRRAAPSARATSSSSSFGPWRSENESGVAFTMPISTRPAEVKLAAAHQHALAHAASSGAAPGPAAGGSSAARAARTGHDVAARGTSPSACASSRQALDLSLDPRVVPAQLAGHAPGPPPAGRPAPGSTEPARVEQAEPRAPQQHVADRARLLVPRRRRRPRRAGRAGSGPIGCGELAALAAASRSTSARRGRSGRRAARRPSVVHARRPRGSVSRRPPASPSGISSVRQGASRPSRSTIRSTAIFAIRRQVVSLPPVIVTMPLEVSYSSALREMSTDFFGSPVEISGRTPA